MASQCVWLECFGTSHQMETGGWRARQAQLGGMPAGNSGVRPPIASPCITHHGARNQHAALEVQADRGAIACSSRRSRYCKADHEHVSTKAPCLLTAMLQR